LTPGISTKKSRFGRTFKESANNSNAEKEMTSQDESPDILAHKSISQDVAFDFGQNLSNSVLKLKSLPLDLVNSANDELEHNNNSVGSQKRSPRFAVQDDNTPVV